jgi:hypothetical protein
MEQDKSTPFALVLIGIFFIVYSFKYRIGSIMSPGVSFFPLVCATGLTVVGLILLGKHFLFGKDDRDKKGDKGPAPQSIWVDKAIRIVAVLLAFAALHAVLGFWISVFGAMVLLQRIAGVSTWRWSVFGGGATMAIGYLIFEYWMGAFFPLGVVGSLVFH